MYDNLGDRIKKEREKMGITQLKLAELIEIKDPVTISKWENNKLKPGRDKILAMANLFKVSTDYLLETEHQTTVVNYRRLRELREKIGLSVEELAEKINETPGFIKKIESGHEGLSSTMLHKIEDALSVPHYFLAEDFLDIEKQSVKKPALSNARPGRFIEIPLLSMEMAASCGGGNGLYGVEADTVDTIPLAWSAISMYDEMHKPFAIHTDGDSMEGAGLEEGSLAVINPAEDVVSGDMALVVYNDAWFIKWVVYNPDGSIDLRSANPAYSTIKVEPEYAQDSSWFRIIGKVIRIVRDLKPRRAF